MKGVRASHAKWMTEPAHSAVCGGTGQDSEHPPALRERSTFAGVAVRQAGVQAGPALDVDRTWRRVALAGLVAVTASYRHRGWSKSRNHRLSSFLGEIIVAPIAQPAYVSARQRSVRSRRSCSGSWLPRVLVLAAPRVDLEWISPPLGFRPFRHIT